MMPSQKSLDYGIPLSIRRLRFIATRGSPGSRGALSTRYLSSELIRLYCENLTFFSLHAGPETLRVRFCAHVWDARSLAGRGNDAVGQPSSTLCSISQDHVPGMMGIFLPDFHMMRELPTVIWIAFVFSWIHHCGIETFNDL